MSVCLLLLRKTEVMLVVDSGKWTQGVIIKCTFE